MNMRLPFIAGLLCPLMSLTADTAKKEPVRVAVIGGMTLGGMWPELAEKFTKETGWPVQLVTTGPKAVLAQALKRGSVDLVTLHASDEATEMVANGLATDMKPWARNEHCIMGPASDPAGIRGLKDGAAAGVFHYADRRVATFAILAMLTGVAAWWRPDGRLSVEALVEAHQDLVLGAVLARPGPAHPCPDTASGL